MFFLHFEVSVIIIIVIIYILFFENKVIIFLGKNVLCA